MIPRIRQASSEDDPSRISCTEAGQGVLRTGDGTPERRQLGSRIDVCHARSPWQVESD